MWGGCAESIREESSSGAYDVNNGENHDPDRVDEVPVPRDHLDVFVVAVLGGPGLVLYLVAWLIVPEEDAAQATGHDSE